ncbi:type II toxin-antitoxin system MqsA family antitoxin, partial [Escherichia coli]
DVYKRQGNAQPHPSTIKLLRVLDKHPELLNEIR